jgi:hypothetical protein
MNKKSFKIKWAYIAAPTFCFISGFPVMVKSESPFFIFMSMIVFGLVIAASLHFYVYIKGKFTGK